MVNIVNKVEMTVNTENTAAVMGSGDLPVFATPAMVALVEKTCSESVKGMFGEGRSTVGTKIEISHVSATPEGMKVWCESELLEEGGRRLRFAVKVYDEKGIVGEGTHERCVIDNKRFMQKTNAKKD